MQQADVLLYIKHIIFLMILFFAKLCFAQNGSEFIVEKKFYSYLDGLPGRSVFGTTQDSRGHLWFITNNGLCRFDGKTFKTFTPKSYGLSSNEVVGVYSDQGDGLILAYSGESVYSYKKIKHFEVFNIKTLEVKSFSEYYKNAPFKIEDIDELYHDTDLKQLCFYKKPFYPLQLGFNLDVKRWALDSHKRFRNEDYKAKKSIFFYRKKGKLEASVQLYKKGDGSRGAKVFITTSKKVLTYYYLNALICYSDNNGGHLIRYKDSISSSYFYLTKDEQITSVDPKNTHFPSFCFDESVEYLYNKQDYQGVIYKKSKRLFLYDGKNTINLIDSTDSDIIQKALVISCLRGKIGSYWIATSEGVLKVSVKKKQFYQLFAQHQIPYGLNNSTRGFYRNENGLWVACFDFIGLLTDKKKTPTLFNNFSNFSFLDCGKQFLVGARGIRTFSGNTFSKSFGSGSEFEEFWSLFPIANNKVLTGVTDLVGVLDVYNNTIIEADFSGFEKPLTTYKFFKHQGKIIGVARNGIFFYNQDGKVIDCYSKNQKHKKKQLKINDIQDLHIDKQGIYWLCSAVNGLFRWDRSTNELENFGIEEGFLSTNHYRIEEDDYNNLWVSTDFGLARFNKISKLARIYTEADGISNNEFNRASSFKDTDGNFYFGGMNGVTYFKPKDLFEKEAENDLPLVINNLSVFDSKINDNRDYLTTYYSNNKITIQGDIKNVSIEVALLDLEDRIHTYAYQISGLDSTWSYINEGNIKLSNLPYGNYNLKVKAQCQNGLWNKTQLIIPLEIPKPFYKTLWFTCLVVLLSALVIVAIIRKRTNFLQEQNQKLELIVGKRTAELEESLSEQTTLLQEVHHRVKNNLQFISAMLKMQLNALKSDADQEVLLETSRRINAMSLVHEMLYSKDKLESVSLKDYLTELISKLEEMVYESDTPIRFDLSIDPIKFNINNCVAIGMITSEVISNSIKHAFTNSENPEIKIVLKRDKKQEVIFFSISDNGNGIKEQLEKKGLGLRLIDIFSRQMGAEYASSNENGLSYRFEIPYEADEQ